MPRFKLALAVFLTGLMCWMPVFQPIAAYAEASGAIQTIAADAENEAASGELESSADDAASNGIESNEDEGPATEADTSSTQGSAEEDAAGDGAQAAGADDASSDAADQDKSATGEALATMEAEDFSSDSEKPSSDASMANSWRYQNGVFVGGDESTEAPQVLTLDSSRTSSVWGIDVSWGNGRIDWAQVKNSGCSFAIIRCGYGWGGDDDQYLRNVQECKKYGIKFGIYLYSYAWDAVSAKWEADWTISQLKTAGVMPGDLSLPVYYDLENEKYGRPAGVDDNNQYRFIDKSQFSPMASTFCNALSAAGYTPGVYANLNWWNNYLTDSVFNCWDRWVAQYNYECNYAGSYSIWQYSNTGSVSGVSGNVDMNYFYGKFLDREAEADALAVEHAGDLPDGTYEVLSAKRSDGSLDAAGGGTAAGTRVQLYGSNGTAAQCWRVRHDGDYVVLENVKSGLVLDVTGGSASSGTSLQLYGANGTRAQKWIAVSRGDGSHELLSALDPYLSADLTWGSVSDGTGLQLYARNDTDAQAFSFTTWVYSGDGLVPIAAEHAGDLPDGTYTFSSSALASSVFEARSGGTSNGTRVQLYEANGTDSQVWTVSHDADGFVTLRNAKSGLALDVAGALAASGQPVQLYEANGTPAQKWVAVAEEGGSVVLHSALNYRLVLDLTGGSIAGGTPLQLYNANGTSAQSWTASPAKTELEALRDLAAEHAGDLPDGVYAVVSGNGSVRQVLDVASGSTSSGAAVQVYESNATDAQRWRVTHDPDGFVTLASVKSGLALDVSGGCLTSGTSLQQYQSNGTRAQKWVAVSRGDGSYDLVSALSPFRAVDVRGGSAASGVPVQLWDSNGTVAQQWSFVSADPAGAPTCSDVLSKGWFRLSPASSASGRVLDVADGSRSNGANVQLYSADGTAAQLFSFEYVDGYYRILNAGSGKVLDVRGGDVVPGANVQLWAVDPGNPNQLWSVSGSEEEGWTFVNKATGLALDIASAADRDGANADAWSPNGTAAQRFSLLAQEDLLTEGTYSILLASSGLAVNVSDASTEDGAGIQLYAPNGTFAQAWYFSKVDGETNTYTIDSLNSGKRLVACDDGSVRQTTAVESPAQYWIPAFEDGYLRFSNGAWPNVVLTASSTGQCASIGVAREGNAALQSFTISRLSDSLPSGTYIVRSAAESSQLVDVLDASISDGANVQIWRNNGSGAQKWVVSAMGDGTYSIMNARSHKMLDVRDALAASGTNVQQWESNGNRAQRWVIKYEGGGWMIASALDSRYVLDISGGHIADGANLQIYESNGTVAQRFTFKATSYEQEYSGYHNPAPYYQVSHKSVNIPHLGQGFFGYRTVSKIPYNATRNDCVNAMITTAIEYVDTTPYVWDYSCAPGVGVDCSGLVMQALYATGMDLSPMNPWDHYHTPGHDHYANDIRRNPRFAHVAFSERQPGDLILTEGHVSIYVGGDRIIEAYSPRVGVRYASVYSTTPILSVARPFV